MKKTMLFVGSVIILILSAITFIFIPAMADGMSNQGSLVFGKYDNKNIEYKPGTEFANAVSNYTEMYRNQGAQLSDSDYFYIYNYAFVSAVQAIAYADAVAKSGYAPSKEAVARQMFPYFADENGNYSQRLFESVSEEDKTNLKTQITKGLIWNRAAEDLLGSQSTYAGNKMFGLKTSDAEKAFIENMASTQRSFEMAVFNKADYPDSAVKAYGTANKDKFVKYNVSVITVKEASKAKSILSKIKKEEMTFVDAVTEYSDKAYTGSDGLLTSSYGYQISGIMAKEADAEKVFALGNDEISEPIETTTGYSIFRCNLAKVEPDFNSKDVLSTVRSYINENEASIVEDYYMAEAEKLTKAASASTLEKACKAASAKYVKVPAFVLNYDNASIFESMPKELSDISADSNDSFLQAAMALKTGEASAPLVTGDNVVVIKASGEDKLLLTDSKKTDLVNAVADMDASASQSTLLTSKKVKNDVSNVFFNKIMKNN